MWRAPWMVKSSALGAAVTEAHRAWLNTLGSRQRALADDLLAAERLRADAAGFERGLARGRATAVQAYRDELLASVSGQVREEAARHRERLAAVFADALTAVERTAEMEPSARLDKLKARLVEVAEGAGLRVIGSVGSRIDGREVRSVGIADVSSGSILVPPKLR